MSENGLVISKNGLATTTAPALGPAERYLMALGSKSSIITMRKRLSQTASAYFDGSPRWHEARWEEIDDEALEYIIRRERERGMSWAYIRQLASAIRGVSARCFRAGLISAETLARIREVKVKQTDKVMAGRFIEEDEQNRMLQVCADDPRPVGRRDGAVLALMYGCGLRRVEILRLDREDVDLSDPTQATILVNGKGARQRYVYLSGGGLRYLQDFWAIRGDHGPELFCCCHQSGKLLPGHRMSGRGTYALFQRRAEQAGIEGVRPHDSRRSYITGLLKRGVDVLLVSRLVGHAQPSTTQRYDMRTQAAAAEAARRLELEYLKSSWK